MTSSSVIHPSIFRAYDIRGTVGKTLWPQDAYAIGRALGLWLQQQGSQTPRVCSAYDGRLSSPEFLKNLHQGLQESGCHVESLGCGPTPLLYFGVKKSGADAGIMITASHNPAEDNGFKICLQDRPFFGEDLKALESMIREQNGVWPSCSVGTQRASTMQETYFEFLSQAFDLASLKVGWDPGHGATCHVVDHLMHTLPGEHRGLYLSIDGRFPAHPPDPTKPENLRALSELVQREGCDVGLAFDGDGDRLGVVDCTGTFVPVDVLIQMYVEGILETHPGGQIIVDVKVSDAVSHTVQKCGGKLIVSRTGHSFIKQKIRETGAVFAGELSGHLFFADRYEGFDDGLYAALRLLEILSKKGPQALVDARRHYEQRYHTSQHSFSIDHPFASIARLQRHCHEKNVPYEAIDGVKRRLDKGWWLLRASNTESLVIGRCEAYSAEDLVYIEKDMMSVWHCVNA